MSILVIWVVPFVQSSKTSSKSRSNAVIIDETGDRYLCTHLPG